MKTFYRFLSVFLFGILTQATSCEEDYPENNYIMSEDNVPQEPYLTTISAEFFQANIVHHGWKWKESWQIDEKGVIKMVKDSDLDSYGRQGVEALSAATPYDTGNTAGSWYYKINRKPRQIFLTKFCRGLLFLCYYMGSDSLRNYSSVLNIRSTDFLLKKPYGPGFRFTDIQRQRPTSQAAPSPPRSLPF